MRAISHRCDLPLVRTEEDGVAPLPVGLPFELKRGFFWVFASPPSLITIFAWISSSFPALTFLGQNNVTNLPTTQTSESGADTRAGSLTHVQRCLLHLSRSSPAACLASSTTSIRRPIAAKDSFRIATLSSRGMSPPDNFSCFCEQNLVVYTRS